MISRKAQATNRISRETVPNRAKNSRNLVEKFSFFPRADYDLHRIACRDAIREDHHSEISYTNFQEIREARTLVYVHS